VHATTFPVSFWCIWASKDFKHLICSKVLVALGYQVKWSSGVGWRWLRHNLTWFSWQLVMTAFWMEVSHAVTGNRWRNPSVLCLCCTIEFWQLCEVDLTGLRCGNLNCKEWNHVKLHVDSHFFVHFAYFKWPDLAQLTMENLSVRCFHQAAQLPS